MLLIHKYMLKQFLNTLIFALLVLCIIFVLVNLLENLDDFMDAKASAMVIIKYYIYFLPDILKMLSPVAILVSSLFTVGKLSNLNEVTAMKSGGMSIYGIMKPFVIVCTLLSFGQLYFNGWLVPRANEQKYYIEKKYLDENKDKTITNFYFRDAALRNLTMQYYDPEFKVANYVSVEDFTDVNKPRMKRKISAESMKWDSTIKQWKMKNVIIRTFDSTGISNNRLETLNISLNISNVEILKLQKNPEQMTLTETKEYLQLLKLGGKEISKLEVDYYSTYAFPFANLIVIFFSIPFASVKKKNGIAAQIAAAMIVAFTYLVFTKFGQSVGIGFAMNPIMSAWLANGIFLIVGLVILYRTKT